MSADQSRRAAEDLITFINAAPTAAQINLRESWEKLFFPQVSRGTKLNNKTVRIASGILVST